MNINNSPDLSIELFGIKFTFKEIITIQFAIQNEIAHYETLVQKHIHNKVQHDLLYESLNELESINAKLIERIIKITNPIL